MVPVPSSFAKNPCIISPMQTVELSSQQWIRFQMIHQKDDTQMTPIQISNLTPSTCEWAKF
jgi:hypothetical protein